MFAEPLNESPWLASRETPRYPSVSRDRSFDVIVVGAGITGATAAYLLKKAGRRVALIDRGRAGWGATGRSTSLVTGVTELPLTRLVAQLGAARAQIVWDAGFAAISRIRATVRDERINCHFSWVPGHLVAPNGSAEARRRMHREAAVAERLGVDARFVESLPGLRRSGVVFPNQAQIHPLRYLEVMLDRIHGDGSQVLENAEVSAVDDRRCRVRVGHAWIRADYLVVATHLPILREAWNPSDVSVRAAFAIRATAPSGQLDEGLYWEQGDATYQYLRVDRHASHDEVILGGHGPCARDHRSGEVSHKALEAKLASLVPQATVTHRWSGPVVLSRDGLPCIGEIGPGRFAAAAFGTNGMTFGTLAGMMAADAAVGRSNAWQDVFDIRRTVGPNDVWAPGAPARSVAGRGRSARAALQAARPATQIDRAPIV
jgi:glycine/D-amino acid oxidase-like deaminating enzyme